MLSETVGSSLLFTGGLPAAPAFMPPRIRVT